MKPMYLADVESFDGPGRRSEMVKQMKAAGIPVPQIFHLLAFKPDRTDPLSQFTHAVMRGPSPFSPGERELIAAFTSQKNQCLF
jgi:alkylhydroperoxidase family enzyme